jgi:hypothetical protein
MTVLTWRKRFAARRFGGLDDEPSTLILTILAVFFPLGLGNRQGEMINRTNCLSWLEYSDSREAPEG